MPAAPPPRPETWLYWLHRGAQALRGQQLRVASIHGADGDAEHGRRGRRLALRGLESGRVDVLIATEMLARGIDIKGATHVVNACMPEDPSSYLHRAGRVGRLGGAPGTVISLPDTEADAKKLHRFASSLGFELVEDELERTLERPGAAA